MSLNPFNAPDCICVGASYPFHSVWLRSILSAGGSWFIVHTGCCNTTEPLRGNRSKGNPFRNRLYSRLFQLGHHNQHPCPALYLTPSVPSTNATRLSCQRPASHVHHRVMDGVEGHHPTLQEFTSHIIHAGTSKS